MILAGDVGGTKTLLGLVKQGQGPLRLAREASFPSQHYPSFEAIVAEFLAAGRERPTTAAVGVAGPVVSGRSQVINLRWSIDRARLARRLGLTRDRVHVINDLEANAWGIAELPPRRFVNLTPGVRPRRGNAALIASGTGLGMALLIRDGDRFIPCASEGGHQQFGPRDELESELLRFMRRRHDRVSIERLVAGPGLSAIYEFLVDSGRGKETRRMSRRFGKTTDQNATISAAALADEDATASRALDLFVSLYGAAAGDLALVAKATAGIYVGGGIAPQILPRLRGGEFLHSFRDKGRLTPLVEQIPIKVILEPRTALIGAAARAARGGKEPTR